jgi:serine protease Do
MSALLAGFLLSQLQSGTPQDQEAFTRRLTPIVKVVQAARPAVVYIETNVPVVSQDWYGTIFRQNQRSSGSGVVIYEDGYIVTNFHVVKGANEIKVQFDTAVDDRIYPAKLINANEVEDLALLKIEGDRPFPTIPMGTSSDLMIGETVVAIGNPYGQTLSVSQGIISGLHRNVQASGLSFSNLIQTDASINPGNSGGPLININGEMIGINTVMNTQAENIGFAIAADQVQLVLKDYLLEPSNARGWLGFEVDVDNRTVNEVTPDGPADAAGLKVGDRVVALNGKPIETSEDYKLARIAVQPGDEAAVRVRRGGGDKSFKLRAWDRADVLTYLRAGVLVEPVVLNTVRAVRVRKVRPGGPAAVLGVRPEDVIETVKAEDWPRARRIGSQDDFALLLTLAAPKSIMEIELWRDDDKNGVFELTNSRTEIYRGKLRLD